MEQINPKELEAFLRAREQEEANKAISQSDGVNIYKSEGNAPGVYIDAMQQQTDAYNQALRQKQAMNAYMQQPQRYIPGPTQLSQFPSAMVGNPNVTIVEPTSQTVGSKWNVAIY